MSRVHSSHMGIDACLRRARDSLFWPGMNYQIRQYVSGCEVCLSTGAKQSKETITQHDVPDKPWAKLASDLFVYEEHDYLITVDYYSNFWEVDYLYKTDSQTVIRKLKAQFARYGVPTTFMSDNGPQFSSDEFHKFSKEWNFKHITSSPRYPQSNGLVENAVEMAKRLMRRAKKSGQDCFLSLLDFRNTPTQGMTSSPAQRLMSRRTRTLLPTAEKLFEPQVVTTALEEKKDLKKKQAFYYNQNARDLNPLKKGDVVRVEPTERKSDWKKAVVISAHKELPRSYDIKTEEGRTLRRNRRHLRATCESYRDTDVSDSDILDSKVNKPTDVTETQPTTTLFSDVVKSGVTTRSGRNIKSPEYLKDYVQ